MPGVYYLSVYYHQVRLYILQKESLKLLNYQISSKIMKKTLETSDVQERLKINLINFAFVNFQELREVRTLSNILTDCGGAATVMALLSSVSGEFSVVFHIATKTGSTRLFLCFYISLYEKGRKIVEESNIKGKKHIFLTFSQVADCKPRFIFCYPMQLHVKKIGQVCCIDKERI